MKIRGSVVSLSFIFPIRRRIKKKKKKSQAISLPTRRRFPNSLFVRALCDRTSAGVQLLVYKYTWRGLTAWSHSSISHNNREKKRTRSCQERQIVPFGACVRPFSIFSSPRVFLLVLPRRIGTAGVCGFYARVMSGCLKLPSLKGFRG